MQLMAIDSKGNIISKDLCDFNKFDMSILSEGDYYKLKLNDEYELCDNFHTKEDAISKMAEITHELNDY